MEILTTTNYSIFRKLEGNRDVNEHHLKRLIKSIKEKYLYTVITVNRNFEVIDGQHRLAACKELQLPVNYIIIEGNIEDVKRYNSNFKMWNTEQYAQTYAELGNENYQKYFELRKLFNLTHTAAFSLLSLKGKPNMDEVQAFKTGEFKVKNYVLAVKIASFVNKYKETRDDIQSSVFLGAIMMLCKNTVFDLDEFENKYIRQPDNLKPTTKTELYIEQIEKIYNYKRREKVNLRF